MVWSSWICRLQKVIVTLKRIMPETFSLQNYWIQLLRDFHWFPLCFGWIIFEENQFHQGALWKRFFLILTFKRISISQPFWVARKMREQKFFLLILAVSPHWKPARPPSTPTPPAWLSLQPISSELTGPLINHARSLSHWQNAPCESVNRFDGSKRPVLFIDKRWCEVLEAHRRTLVQT